MTAPKASELGAVGELAELGAVFAAAGCHGFLHARACDGGGEVGWRADELVVLASVFKIPVMVEVAAQALDPGGAFSFTDRVRVTPDQHVMGPTGISAMRDEVELSVRDLAQLMMSVSDNTATDVLVEMVGVDAVNKRLRDLGLVETELIGGCASILDDLVAELGLSGDRALADVPAAERMACRQLQPEVTSRTTAREMSELLRLIWADDAAPPEACAEVRRIMALQVWPHRLRVGFPGTVRIAAKTGTLILWRNEAGVIEQPDGTRHAVAVFTRAHSVDDPQPAVDASIGAAARLAVDHLLSRP